MVTLVAGINQVHNFFLVLYLDSGLTNSYEIALSVIFYVLSRRKGIVCYIED